MILRWTLARNKRGTVRTDFSVKLDGQRWTDALREALIAAAQQATELGALDFGARV